MASPQRQQPPASEEELHLAQLATAGATAGPAADAEVEAARRAVQHDLEQHFVSAGAQMEGDVQTSKFRPTAERGTEAPGSGTSGEMQQELLAMAAAHEDAAGAGPQGAGGGQMGMSAGGSFVRGHAAQELSFASEEMDAA